MGTSQEAAPNSASRETTTINIYVKMVTREAEEAMKRLESNCSLTVPQLQFESPNWEQKWETRVRVSP
jgi:hypothetical protein